MLSNVIDVSTDLKIKEHVSNEFTNSQQPIHDRIHSKMIQSRPGTIL